MDKISRRNFIKTMSVTATAAAVPPAVLNLTASKSRKATPMTTSKDFCFVHMSDPHVRYKRRGDLGYAKCIAAINDVKPQADFVITGGDLCFDGNYTAKDEYIRSIDLYKTITDQLKMPYYNCLGNHDAFGLSSRRKCPDDDPDIGKKLIMDKLGMTAPYYSFDHKGWHFAILDSAFQITTTTGPTQLGKIGDEQLDWLRYDLGKAHGKPTIVVTHVAAFCAMVQVNGDNETNDIKSGMVLQDNKQLRLILERHKVKALLQGHSHWAEDYRFHDVWYITSQGAGACWWAGEWLGAPPGFTVLKCQGNELSWERKSYHLDYQLEPEDNLERKLNAEHDAFLAEQQELLKKEIAGK